MAKWLISIAVIMLLSVSSSVLSAQTAPMAVQSSMPATVIIELTWRYTTNSEIYKATVQTLGTLISPKVILTHSHFGVSLNNLSAGTLTITDQTGRSTQWNTTDVQQIVVDKGTSLIWLPNEVVTPPAPFASATVVQRLAPGDWLAVNYWDDTTHRQARQDFKILRIQNGIAKLADPERVINPGDSGGGAYFNGQLVGNTWSINLDGAGRATGSFNVALLPAQVQNLVK